MNKTVAILQRARGRVPAALRDDLTFDAWLFGVVFEALAPAERGIVQRLARDGATWTADLLSGDATPEQVGATLARLRRMKLVTTVRQQGAAYHDLAGWARVAAPVWLVGECAKAVRE